jgi:hypothetical protein
MKNSWIGLALVADGALGLIWPRRYLRLLKVGPQNIKELFETFAENPQLTRALCIGEIALGLWLATTDNTKSEQIVEKFKGLGEAI